MNAESELEKVLEWVEGVRTRVHEIAQEWQDEEGSLIMILHAIQNELGYVPRGVANELSKATGISLARIYEVITFYTYFRLAPPGNHEVQVCMGTACYLRGAETIQDKLLQQLEFMKASGGPADDFQVESVRCIGCCGMSPAVVVDGKTYGRLDPDDAPNILKQKQGA
ncbi:MAG: NAD(P)H-dependent oxidoreductase subunit E [Spirochaetota bacterium]